MERSGQKTAAVGLFDRQRLSVEVAAQVLDILSLALTKRWPGCSQVGRRGRTIGTTPRRCNRRWPAMFERLFREALEAQAANPASPPGLPTAQCLRSAILVNEALQIKIKKPDGDLRAPCGSSFFGCGNGTVKGR